MSVAAVIVEPGRAQPLRWWSHTEREAAGRKLRPVLEIWARAWGLQLERVCAELPGPSPQGPHAGERSDMPARPVLLGSGGRSIAEVLHLLMFDEPCTRSAPRSVAQELAARAEQALQDHLLAALPATPVPALPPDRSPDRRPVQAPVQPAPRHRWCGAIQFDVTLSGASQSHVVHLHFDPALAQDWCAALPARRVPRTANRLPLQPINQAIGSMPVRVSVELTPVDLGLGALRALRVGDVITLPQRTDQSLHVLIHSEPGRAGRPMCRGHLAMRAGRRVVELCGNHETP